MPDLGYDQVVGRSFAFTFVFGPHIFSPSIFLLSQGTVGIQKDKTSIPDIVSFQNYREAFTGEIFGSLLFILVLTYLIWVMAMGAITLATQHLLVPPIRNGDIVRQHSYSAAIRHLYANLVRRLHSLTFFLSTGKLHPLFRI